MSTQFRADALSMNTHISKARRVAAVALAVAIVPFAASTASAATTAKQGKRATWTKASTTTSTAAAATTTTAAATTTTQAPVTAIHAIGGYIFVNVTYLEAVELYFKAVAAAPAGYTPPPVTSISATTTVSGTVTEPGR